MGAVRRFHLTLVTVVFLLLLLMVYLFAPPTLNNSKSLVPLNSNSSKETMRHSRRNSNQTVTGDLYIGGHEQSHPELCPTSGAELQLVILVASTPPNAVARDAIRKTWGHYAFRSDVVIAFVIGTPPENLTFAIEEEDMLYGDIIIGRFIDTPFNLTLKTLSMLEWVDTYCPRVPRLLKTVDNMFINVPKLIEFVTEPLRAKVNRTIWGKVWKYLEPKRHTKLKDIISPLQNHPDYTGGPAYLLTTDVVKDILYAALNEPYLDIEDVFITGVLGSKLGIERRDEPLFYNQWIAPRSHPCFVRKMISFPRVRYDKIYDVWQKIFNETFNCDLYRLMWVPKLVKLNAKKQ